MRQTLIAGNWKMNGNSELLASFAAKALPETKAEVLLCVPNVLLSEATQQLAGSGVKIGAQNVSEYGNGAYTGEVSADMLAAVGCSYAIVGHSERRSLFHETNEQVADKARQALDAGLCPIVCVGETLAEREAGEQERVVQEQLQPFADFANLVIAYEPVWAIGTGLAATAAQAQAMHAFIRGIVGQDTQILYGGSMKPSNATELLQQEDIDGGLIGGASLQPGDFYQIVAAA